MKKYKDFGIYDFSDYAEEVTGDALFKINGGSTSCSNEAPSAPPAPKETAPSQKTTTTTTTTPAPSPAQTTTTPSGPTGPSGNPSDTENKTTTGSWGRVDETYRNTNMQQYKETEVDKKMNGSNLFSLVGCKMQAAAKMVSTILGKTFSMEQINDTFDTNKDGLLPRDEIEAGIKQNLPNGKSVKMDYWELSLSKEILDKEIPALGGTTYVLGRAEDVHGGQHWVVLEGYSMNEFGQVQFDVNYTSANDKNYGRTYILGQPNENQANTHRISRIETFTIY